MRAFFIAGKALQRNKHYNDLVRRVSPHLKQEVVNEYQLWVKDVPYLHDSSKSFVCSFIDSMAGNLYSKDEFIDNGQ